MRRNDIKCKYMFMITLKNLARKGLTLESAMRLSDAIWSEMSLAKEVLYRTCVTVLSSLCLLMA